MQMHKLSFCEMDVGAQPVLRPSGRARSTAVLFHGGRGELLASFSRLCAKAVSGSINCAAGFCSVRWGGVRGAGGGVLLY